MLWLALRGGEKLMPEVHSISALSRRVAFPKWQIAFLTLLFAVAVPLILATMEQDAFNAVVLLGCVSIGGLVLCRRTQIRLNDPRLKVLGYFWLIKLGLTLFLLYAGWIPMLDPQSSPLWGYDPQRYYIQAQELIENGWVPTFANVSYTGILYYYSVIYYLIGFNPVIPALFNSFVTLVATLYLVRVGYEIKPQRATKDWTLAFVLLLPEMVWYDVLTSRETLMSALLVFALVTAGRYIGGISRSSLLHVLIVIGVTSLMMAAIRTSLLLAVFAAVFLMIMIVKPSRGKRNFMRKIVLITAAIVLLAIGPIITNSIGGYKFDWETTIKTATEGNLLIRGDVTFSNNSLGQLLIPDGLLQAGLYIVPRMILYLVAPLPKIPISVTGMLAGNWADWQMLFIVLGSVVNIVMFPFVLASFVQAIKIRMNNPGPLILNIAYWVNFVAIAGGNIIIHERYRVMAALFFFGCAWYGASTCTKELMLKSYMVWCGVLGIGAVFYISHKYA